LAKKSKKIEYADTEAKLRALIAERDTIQNVEKY
jgi:hypothetical protein